MPIDPFSGLSADQTRIISDAIKDARTIDKLRMMAGTDVIDKCVFGSVVWAKNLGRPGGPKMSDHLDLDLCHTRRDHDDELGGTRETTVRFPIVGKWDDDDDGLVYRVSFAQGGLDPRDFWIEIKFAVGSDWAVGTFHFVPEVQSFTKALGPVWLKPFQISVKSPIVVDPWKSAGRLKL